jgi:hypothetical protein
LLARNAGVCNIHHRRRRRRVASVNTGTLNCSRTRAKVEAGIEPRSAVERDERLALSNDALKMKVTWLAGHLLEPSRDILHRASLSMTRDLAMRKRTLRSDSKEDNFCGRAAGRRADADTRREQRVAGRAESR